jgi:hypothetical protein
VADNNAPRFYDAVHVCLQHDIYYQKGWCLKLCSHKSKESFSTSNIPDILLLFADVRTKRGGGKQLTELLPACLQRAGDIYRHAIDKSVRPAASLVKIRVVCTVWPVYGVANGPIHRRFVIFI